MSDDLLEERERSEEARFKQNQELRFKAQARRNRLLGLWAAEKMGMPKSKAEEYAKEIVMVDFEEPGDEDVIRRILKDFTSNGVDAVRDDVVEEMKRLLAVAMNQLAEEFPKALGSDHVRVGD